MKKEGEEVLQVLKQRFPASCGEDYREKACPSAAHKINGGAVIRLQPAGDCILEVVDARSCG